MYIFWQDFLLLFTYTSTNIHFKFVTRVLCTDRHSGSSLTLWSHSRIWDIYRIFLPVSLKRLLLYTSLQYVQTRIEDTVLPFGHASYVNGRSHTIGGFWKGACPKVLMKIDNWREKKNQLMKDECDKTLKGPVWNIWLASKYIRKCVIAVQLKYLHSSLRSLGGLAAVWHRHVSTEAWCGQCSGLTLWFYLLYIMILTVFRFNADVLQ